MKGKHHGEGGGGKGATKNPHKGNDAMKAEGAGKTDYGSCQGNGLTGKGSMDYKYKSPKGGGGGGSSHSY